MICQESDDHIWVKIVSNHRVFIWTFFSHFSSENHWSWQTFFKYLSSIGKGSHHIFNVLAYFRIIHLILNVFYSLCFFKNYFDEWHVLVYSKYLQILISILQSERIIRDRLVFMKIFDEDVLSINLILIHLLNVLDSNHMIWYIVVIIIVYNDWYSDSRRVFCLGDSFFYDIWSWLMRFVHLVIWRSINQITETLMDSFFFFGQSTSLRIFKWSLVIQWDHACQTINETYDTKFLEIPRYIFFCIVIQKTIDFWNNLSCIVVDLRVKWSNSFFMDVM